VATLTEQDRRQVVDRHVQMNLFPAVEATETGGKLDCEPVSTVVE
jgi:hypothetical protein